MIGAARTTASIGLVMAMVMLGPVGIQPRSAYAGITNDFVKTFPRGWCGLYMWRGGSLRQHFSIVFTKVKAIAGGRVEATGNGLIGIPARQYPIKVRAVMEPSSGAHPALGDPRHPRHRRFHHRRLPYRSAVIQPEADPCRLDPEQDR